MTSIQGALNPLEITAPIFLSMAVGYLAVRFKYFPAEGIKGLSAFVAMVAVPALMFQALASRDLTKMLDESYLLAYALGSLIPFVFVFMYARVVRKEQTGSAAFYGMGGSFSNTIMVGFPVATSIFGDAALIPLALTLLVENLLMMPLTIALANSAQNKQESLPDRVLMTLGAIVRNPIIIAMLLGVLVSLTGVTLPAVANSTMSLLTSTVSGVALFSIGGMLVGLHSRGLLPDIGAITMTKLILHPLCMLAAFSIVGGVTAGYAQVGFILACSPMFSIYAVIGGQYDRGPFCAAAMLPTTILSFVSISLFIWLQQLYG